MCQYLKFSTLDLQKWSCSIISIVFQYHSLCSPVCLTAGKLVIRCPKFGMPSEIIWVMWDTVSRAGLCFSCLYTQDPPWAYLLASYELGTQSSCPAFDIDDHTQTSKLQALAVLPIPHQKHQLSHLPASFRPSLTCSMRAYANPKKTFLSTTICSTEQLPSHLANHQTEAKLQTWVGPENLNF